MPTDLEEMITQHFGVSAAQLTSALDTLPPIRPEAAALSDDEAALYDEVDFAEDDSAYARVTLAAAGHTARLISTAYSANEVAELLGVSASRVRQRRLDRTLWAIEDAGGWVFPALQFENADGRRRQIRHLDQVLPAIPADLHPLAVARLLNTPQADLAVEGKPVSPLQWLRDGGDVRAVRTLITAADWPVGDSRRDAAQSPVRRRTAHDRDTAQRIADGSQDRDLVAGAPHRR